MQIHNLENRDCKEVWVKASFCDLYNGFTFAMKYNKFLWKETKIYGRSKKESI